MSPPITLPAGANHPLDGAQVAVELTAASLGGALLLAEDSGAPRPVGPGDPIGGVRVTGDAATATIALAAVPASVTRLRLVAWSVARSRLLLPASARVVVDGTPVAVVAVGTPGGHLRSAEVLEVYRRHGAWKVRAIGSGWEDGLPAMARALGLPEAAFPAAVPPAPSTVHRPRPAPGHTAPAGPQVGPPALRAIVDGIAGPGPRQGDHDSLMFELSGVAVRLRLERQGDAARLTAIVPLGTGPRTDATAEAALRATGAAAVSRVCVPPDGGALSSAVVLAGAGQVDSALAKALLSDAWVTAADFGERVRPIGWALTERLTRTVPRELRLGVAEELQDVEAWRGVHERLVENSCLPLADEPSALLAVGAGGQLVIGPTLLLGTSRAWAIVVERVLRADVPVRGGLWRALADHNSVDGPVRIGVVDEPGPAGPPAVVASYGALQVPRTQVLEDLQHGLEAVDGAAAGLEHELSRLTPGASRDRDDLPWPAHRRWKGPGTEVREEPLVRELTTLPENAAPPGGYGDRVRRDAGRLGRPGVAYVAHLALSRAEMPGAPAAWLPTAAQLVSLAPVAGLGAPSATASLHARLRRLRSPGPAGPPGPARARGARVPPPLPRPAPSAGGPANPDATGAPPDAPPGRRRRWRIFG